ncbi:MAG: phosphate ABC transporter substrate-binding protein [Phycisphaerae bacterium]|nr:phosphate ABC transporter substrate-binding protein [Phycisphaerae bacterium]
MTWIPAVTAAVLSLSGASAQKVEIDSALPQYKAGASVSGTIKSVGSDTMNNLMTSWGEEFKKLYPNVKIEIEGKGSSTAPPALIEGLAQFGPMSRPMKDSELDAFEKKYGYKPTSVRVAVDALAVYVHKDNPIKSLTMEQILQIFSVKGKADLKWGDLGLTGDWADKPVSLYGRNSASGTYGYFKEHALAKADFKPTVKEQPGSSAVVQGVATDKYAIGYSGIGYRTADVKAIPLASGKAAPVEPTPANALSGEYPLARFLMVYLNLKPGGELDPLRKEFVKMMFSRQGQEVVVKDGYDPIPSSVAREDLKKCGIEVKF